MTDEEINKVGKAIFDVIIANMKLPPKGSDLMAVLEKTVGASIRMCYPTLIEQVDAAEKFRDALVDGLEHRHNEEPRSRN